LFYVKLITLVSRKICSKFCRNTFIIARDIAYIRIEGEGQPPEEVTYFNFFYLKLITLFWGGCFSGGYGCSALKGDILHPRVQETFPKFFVKIGWLLLFISFYGKFRKIAEKATFHFFTETNNNFEKLRVVHPHGYPPS